MLDKCAEVKPGWEVVILAEVDGLYGGDSPVDEDAISWIQAGVVERGATRLGPVDRRARHAARVALPAGGQGRHAGTPTS